MKSKWFSIVLLSLMGVAPAAVGEEGMWLPPQLPGIAEDLQALGLEIAPRQLADLAGYPMGAIAKLGGCSASFVSPDGLLITNYHCAHSSVQLNSSVQRNLLAQGFLAASRQEELPAAPDLRVYVTMDLQDVSGKVLEGLDGVGGEERSAAIESRRKALTGECEESPGSRCRVASFFGGTRYWLIRQVELRDLRLVYAPPEGIGLYGGDEENFSWPQQRGDFAFFRAYAGPDGKPADPGPDNRVFRPRHVLRIAREPVAEGDLLLVAGYPGTTNRYRTSSEVEHNFLWNYPRLIQSYQTWARTIEEAVESRPDTALQYASFVAGLRNTLKYTQGMVDHYAESGMLERKLALERELEAWIDQDLARKAAYGSILSELREAFARRRETRELGFRSHMATRSTLLGAAGQIYRLSRERARPEGERAAGFRPRDEAKLRQSLEKSLRGFDARVDRAVWKTFLLEYHQMPAGQRNTVLDRWFHLKPGRRAGTRIDRVLDRMYGQTRLGDLAAAGELLEAKPEEVQTSRDPFLQLAIQLDETSREEERREQTRSRALEALYARYMEALVRFKESRGETLYPDANSTLRVAFGKVQGYTTSQGVRQKTFTTAEDVLARDRGTPPFNTPPAVLAALREGRFGPYRDQRLSSLPVDFLGTVDVTGGNSGAPTLNRRGELVGLLFDINGEGIISSWDYNPAKTRSVHLDIRYVLWLMSEIDDARPLLAEMGILPPQEVARR